VRGRSSLPQISDALPTLRTVAIYVMWRGVLLGDVDS